MSICILKTLLLDSTQLFANLSLLLQSYSTSVLLSTFGIGRSPISFPQLWLGFLRLSRHTAIVPLFTHVETYNSQWHLSHVVFQISSYIEAGPAQQTHVIFSHTISKHGNSRLLIAIVTVYKNLWPRHLIALKLKIACTLIERSHNVHI